MPNSKMHKLIGASAGAVAATVYGCYIAHDPQNAWQYGIGDGLGGYALSRLADVLEPAKKLGPNHRGVFHAVTPNGAIIIFACNHTKEWLQSLTDEANELDKIGEHLNAFLRRLLVGFLVGGIGGHVSHLIADLTTTKRLPLLY